MINPRHRIDQGKVRKEARQKASNRRRSRGEGRGARGDGGEGGEQALVGGWASRARGTRPSLSKPDPSAPLSRRAWLGQRREDLRDRRRGLSPIGRMRSPGGAQPCNVPASLKADEAGKRLLRIAAARIYCRHSFHCVSTTSTVSERVL